MSCGRSTGRLDQKTFSKDFGDFISISDVFMFAKLIVVGLNIKLTLFFSVLKLRKSILLNIKISPLHGLLFGVKSVLALL